MNNNLKLYIYIYVPFWFLFQSGNHFNINDLQTITHHVVVNHPGEKNSIEAILIEVQNKNGYPIEYYMDVESVICLEQVCKVIPVRLFWNNIGEYKRYELKEGETLEKYEADIFEKEDYKKLHEILSNSNSPFKGVWIDEILTVSDSNEDVDAVSGATILELDEEDTVQGASLTCYTLWHWVNGDMVSIIKTITGKSVSNTQLLEFLKNANTTYYYIAIPELMERNIYSKPFVEAIFESVLSNNRLLKISVNYLESAPLDIYLLSMKQMVTHGSKEQKIAALKSLQYIEYNIDKSYFNNLVHSLDDLDSFQEVTSFLDLMQIKNSDSSIINDEVLSLLEREFLIARRAFYFLNDMKLNPQQQRIVDAFYETYKEKL